jgi:hypothetical protein
MSRRHRIGALVTLAALASGGIVFAGAKSIAPLSVNVAGRFASGGLAETHNTPDLTQYAECGSNPTAGFCTLRDSAGTFYSCFTTDPALIAVIRSMSPDSYFSISWDASGTCTYVLSYASSRVPPRAP